MVKQTVFRVYSDHWVYRDAYGNDWRATSWSEMHRLIRDYIEALATGEANAKNHALRALGELHYLPA